MKKFAQLELKKNEEKALGELKQRLLKKFSDVEIILYGSKVRGTSQEFSDIDLLIILNCKVNRKLKEEITKITYELELKHDVVFGTIVENREFWNSRLAKAMPFRWNIDKEGVRL